MNQSDTTELIGVLTYESAKKAIECLNSNISKHVNKPTYDTYAESALAIIPNDTLSKSNIVPEPITVHEFLNCDILPSPDLPLTERLLDYLTTNKSVPYSFYIDNQKLSYRFDHIKIASMPDVEFRAVVARSHIVFEDKHIDRYYVSLISLDHNKQQAIIGHRTNIESADSFSFNVTHMSLYYCSLYWRDRGWVWFGYIPHSNDSVIQLIPNTDLLHSGFDIVTKSPYQVLEEFKIELTQYIDLDDNRENAISDFLINTLSEHFSHNPILQRLQKVIKHRLTSVKLGRYHQEYLFSGGLTEMNIYSILSLESVSENDIHFNL